MHNEVWIGNRRLVTRCYKCELLQANLVNGESAVMNSLQGRVFGGIDAGGESFKCGIADPEGKLIAKSKVPTSTPLKTIQGCVDFLLNAEKRLRSKIAALGIGSFGQLDVNPKSDIYGTILETPKIGWSMTPLKTIFEKELAVPVAIDTDVNVALLAEMCFEANHGHAKSAYITVGSGIGASIRINNSFLGFPRHPEFGHISVKRHALDADFSGVCSFHRDCLEGLASAPAFEKRFGNPRRLPADHPGWDIEAYYLAQACMSLSLTARLDRIYIGGGLMRASHLISLIRRQFLAINENYLPFTEQEVSEMIVYPSYGFDSGLRGALMLAMDLAELTV